MRKPFSIIIILCSFILLAQGPTQRLTMARVMTPQELRDTGVGNLTVSQRLALDAWLNRYTVRVVQIAINQPPDNQTPSTVNTRCNPAIESTISGDFEGWEGETIFKLDNGQIWKQAEYAYMYSYSYRPDVTIYQTSAGCRMKVEDEDETILVHRIK